jgi:Na+-translocating ferredoxin:NAD+ oxidoreductase subunit B
MSATMTQDVYATKLVSHLNTLHVPFLETESGVEIRLLKRWFTEEGAQIALGMKGKPETVAPGIADRLGTPPEALSPILERMSKKGLIFRIFKGEHRFYNIIPLVISGVDAYLEAINFI